MFPPKDNNKRQIFELKNKATGDKTIANVAAQISYALGFLSFALTIGAAGYPSIADANIRNQAWEIYKNQGHHQRD